MRCERQKNLKLHNSYCDIKTIVLGWEAFVKEHSSLIEWGCKMNSVHNGGMLMERGIENHAWSPTGPRIIRVNVDAAISIETRGMALTARDHRDKLILLKSVLA